MAFEPPFPIGHLHKGDQYRIKNGNLYPDERAMLSKGQDPWVKFRGETELQQEASAASHFLETLDEDQAGAAKAISDEVQRSMDQIAIQQAARRRIEQDQPASQESPEDFQGVFGDIHPSQISSDVGHGEFGDIKPLGKAEDKTSDYRRQELSVSTGDTLQQPRKISLELADNASASMRDSPPTNDEVVSPRWFNRFRWFRWLRAHPAARKASGGAGVILALLIAKQGLDYEINGAWKTAAVVFLAAWAVLAFAIYVSNMWDKRRPFVSVFWVLAGAILVVVWWGYLPGPPSQSAKAPTSGLDPLESRITTEPTRSRETRVFTNADGGYLVGLYKQYSTAQADQAVKTYIGKWIKVTGTVGDVTREEHRGEPLTASVSIRVEPVTKDGSRYVVVASFGDQASVDRALVLNRNEHVTIVGKIKRVLEPGMILDQCEFLDASR